MLADYSFGVAVELHGFYEMLLLSASLIIATDEDPWIGVETSDLLTKSNCPILA